jgi:DNA-binding response OmpR family regulator
VINRTLCIVDDESSFRLRFKLVLARVGITVQKFVDLPDTQSLRVEYIRAKEAGDPFSLLFVDINLKGSDVDGLDMVKEMRSGLNGFPVICVISTSARQSEIDQARVNGANAYIVKTGDLAKFSDRMKSFKENYIDKRVDEFMVFGNEG